jgi:ATP-dependent Lon protease
MLASALGAQHYTLCFDSPIAGSALPGVDPQWGTGKPGFLIDAVGLGSCANPVIVLDEIDKALRSRNDNPLGPLHTLLERGSATQFRDIFVDLRFDASLVTWIATANDAQRIPSTIRSRMTEIMIGAPEGAQAIEQAIAIIAEVIRMDAPPGFSQVSRALCVELAHLTPSRNEKSDQQRHPACSRKRPRGRATSRLSARRIR